MADKQREGDPVTHALAVLLPLRDTEVVSDWLIVALTDLDRVAQEQPEGDADLLLLTVAVKDVESQPVLLPVLKLELLSEALAHDEMLPVERAEEEIEGQPVEDTDGLEDAEGQADPVPERHKEGEPLPQPVADELPLREIDTVTVPVTVLLNDMDCVAQAHTVGEQVALRQAVTDTETVVL